MDDQASFSAHACRLAPLGFPLPLLRRVEFYSGCGQHFESTVWTVLSRPYVRDNARCALRSLEIHDMGPKEALALAEMCGRRLLRTARSEDSKAKYLCVQLARSDIFG